MIKIHKIHIKRYRSIIDLELVIDDQNNFITICGENNTGKTNSLKAVDLFFNPDKYVPEQDIPHHKFEGSRGGATCPEISIEFLLENNDIYRITKKFDLKKPVSVEGKKLKVKEIRSKQEPLTETEIKSLFKKISFFFIESINISFPDVINNLMDDLYDIEYEKARFSGLKSDLKVSFDKYTSGLLDVLNKLSTDINPLFQEYQENWGIGFDLETDVKKFRDLITNEIIFYINDGSNTYIEGKGSGLQRLAYILLHSRIIDKIKSKSIFLLIDEPDVYLHQGLQKKLYKHLLDISKNSQVVITTHSPVFINSYSLENVFLLDLDKTEKTYKRRGKTYTILSTTNININQNNGSKKIKSYLGIEESDYDLLENYNLIVEGETDKFYLEELLKFFNLPIPNVIPAHGADNIIKYIEFYNSYYQNNSNNPNKPKILILLDNDAKGRDIFLKIDKDKNKYSFLEIDLKLVPNFLGETPQKIDLKINTDHQIEDFLYPKLLCELVNRLLKKGSYNTINIKNIDRKIKTSAFKDRGILNLIETEKNEKNPNNGQKINFTSSNSERVKKGLSNLFKIQGDKKIIEIIKQENEEHPHVKEFLEAIADIP